MEELADMIKKNDIDILEQINNPYMYYYYKKNNNSHLVKKVKKDVYKKISFDEYGIFIDYYDLKNERLYCFVLKKYRLSDKNNLTISENPTFEEIKEKLLLVDQLYKQNKTKQNKQKKN